MINISINALVQITLPVLESLEIEDRLIPASGYPILTCPRLRLFARTTHSLSASFSAVIECELSDFTASIETVILRSTRDCVETLHSAAVLTLSHCKKLRTFLFEGGICISAQDWLVLQKVHDHVDRAIFILPDAQSEAEYTFRVSFLLQIDQGRY